MSHETIYQALYVQTRGELRADLHKQLSLKRSARKPRGGRSRGGTPYAEAFKIIISSTGPDSPVWTVIPRPYWRALRKIRR